MHRQDYAVGQQRLWAIPEESGAPAAVPGAAAYFTLLPEGTPSNTFTHPAKVAIHGDLVRILPSIDSPQLVEQRTT